MTESIKIMQASLLGWPAGVELILMSDTSPQLTIQPLISLWAIPADACIRGIELTRTASVAQLMYTAMANASADRTGHCCGRWQLMHAVLQQ